MKEEQKESIVERKQQGIEKAQHRAKLMKVGAGLFLFVMIVAASATAVAVRNYRQVDIVLQPASAEILQGEEVPVLQAEAVCTEQDKLDNVLDADSGYKVRDLIQALNAGEGYEIGCDADVNTEGAYKMNVTFTKAFQAQLSEDWNGWVHITVADAELTVKNKLGEWDGDKFQRWDGSYIVSDFLEYQGDTYYLNDEGVKVTGVQQVGIMQCTFDEEGKLTAEEQHIDPEKPMMALTFDDGPGEYTAELLAILEKYHAHATFFMLGQNLGGQEEVVKKMQAIGCELGNHSYGHPQLSKIGVNGIKDQMDRTNALISCAVGTGATVMRPPYGDHAGAVKSTVDLPIILWNVDTLDWKTKDTQQTIANVKADADDGDIVLMHDIHKPTVDAVAELVPYLIKQGYQLVTVSELAQARGVTLEPGVVYTDFNL